MKVHQLIHRLQLFPPDAKIWIKTNLDGFELEKPLTPAMIYKDPSDNIVWIDTDQD